MYFVFVLLHNFLLGVPLWMILFKSSADACHDVPFIFDQGLTRTFWVIPNIAYLIDYLHLITYRWIEIGFYVNVPY